MRVKPAHNAFAGAGRIIHHSQWQYRESDAQDDSAKRVSRLSAGGQGDSISPLATLEWFSRGGAYLASPEIAKRVITANKKGRANSEQALLEIGLYLAQYHVRRYQPQSSSFTGPLSQKRLVSWLQCRRGDTAPSVHRRPPACSQCPFTRVVVHQRPLLSAVICWLRCQKGCQSPS
jgi:hypothetical protein